MREEAYFLYEHERQYQVRFPHVTVPMFPDFTFGLVNFIGGGNRRKTIDLP
jgi:hypothetical protein